MNFDRTESANNMPIKLLFTGAILLCTAWAGYSQFNQSHRGQDLRYSPFQFPPEEELTTKFEFQIEAKLAGIPKWNLPSFSASGGIKERPGAIVAAVSVAEGTGNIDQKGHWQPNLAYYGHGDPNRRVLNMGAFSYQFYQLNQDNLTAAELTRYNSFVNEARAIGITDLYYAPRDAALLQKLRKLAMKYGIPEMCDRRALNDLGFKKREAMVLEAAQSLDFKVDYGTIVGAIDLANQTGSEVIPDYVKHSKKLQEVLSQIKDDPNSQESKDILAKFVGPDLASMPSNFYRNPGQNMSLTPANLLANPRLQSALVGTLSLYYSSGKRAGKWGGGGYSIIAQDEGEATGPQVALSDLYRRAKKRLQVLIWYGIGLTNRQEDQLKVSSDEGNSPVNLSPAEQDEQENEITFGNLQKITPDDSQETVPFNFPDDDAQKSGLNKRQVEKDLNLQLQKDPDLKAQNLKETTEHLDRMATLNFGIEEVPVNLVDLTTPEESTNQLLESSNRELFKSDRVVNLSDAQIQDMIKKNQLTAYDLKNLPNGAIPPSDLAHLEINETVMTPGDPNNMRGRWHNGIDAMVQPGGKNVISTVNGTVIKAVEGVESSGNESGNIGWVVIQGFDGNLYFYLHNTKVHVNVGQQVWVGTDLAEVGGTGGTSTGKHVHYARVDTKFGSPDSMLKAAKEDLRLVNEGNLYFREDMLKDYINAIGNLLTRAGRPELIPESRLRNSDGSCDSTALAQATGLDCNQFATAQIVMHQHMREASNKAPNNSSEIEIDLSSSATNLSSSDLQKKIDFKLGSRIDEADLDAKKQKLRREGAKILDAAFFDQFFDYNGNRLLPETDNKSLFLCGPTTAMMILRYFEIFPSRDNRELSSKVGAIADKVGSTDYLNKFSTFPETMRAFIKSQGLNTAPVKWDFESVKAQLEQNHPVTIFHILPDDYATRHISLIVGYKEPNLLIIHDPLGDPYKTVRFKNITINSQNNIPVFATFEPQDTEFHINLPK